MQHTMRLTRNILYLSIAILVAGCSKAPDCVVLGKPETHIWIKKESANKYKIEAVEIDDKRFGSAVPMITSGPVSRLEVGGQRIELVDGEVKNGLLMTKHYGPVRILGISTMYLCISPEQKNRLIETSNNPGK